MMTRRGTARTPGVKTCGQSASTGSYAVVMLGVIPNPSDLFPKVTTKKIRISDELFRCKKTAGRSEGGDTAPPAQDHAGSSTNWRLRF